MTLGTKPLTSKPGEFFARCNLGRIVKLAKATPEQHAEAAALGLHRRVLGEDSRNRPIWGWSFPVHDDVFMTADRAAYQAHLEEFHNGGMRKLSTPARIRTRKPRAIPVTPLKDRDDLRKCPTCDLHGEARGTAGELWWDEHVRGCALLENGRQLASQRDDLIAQGVDPSVLAVPIAPDMAS